MSFVGQYDGYQVLDPTMPVDEGTLARPDGSPWPLVVVTPGGTIGSDTATKVLSVILPSYGDLGDDNDGLSEAFLLRRQFAVQLADNFQFLLCGFAEEQGMFDPAVETPEVVNAVLQSRFDPVEGLTEWANMAVPLVLIHSDYAPYTSRVAPVGNIVWIDPTDEMTLLRSMHHIGVIELHERAPVPA